MSDSQQLFDVAVIVPTMLRPSLDVAIRSIFEQDLDGRIQIMIGIDKVQGSRDLLDALIADCPKNMHISVVDLGYSTSSRNGGLYGVLAGGSLRTTLCYLANSTHVAFLDDDNWWAPNHLSSLRAAIRGFDWAYSLRWYVDPDLHQPLCIDEWESVGPGKGIYAQSFGGFVDTNTLMIDKIACHWMLPAWCLPLTNVGRGEDRAVFDRLRRQHSVAWTNEATSFYVFRSADRPLIDKLLAKREPEERRSAPTPGPGPKGKGRIVDHRIGEYLNSAESPRLHLGAGAVFLEGWLNTDLNPQSADVVRLDATTPLPFQNGDFDFVLAERLIEHLEYGPARFMLSECFRVLKPGGRVRITTPDLQRFFALYSRSPTKAQNRFMAWVTCHFIQDAPEVHPTLVLNNLFRNWGHRFIYDADTLTKVLRDAGFRDLKPYSMGQSDDPDLWGLAGRGEVAAHEMLQFETMVWEGRKP